MPAIDPIILPSVIVRIARQVGGEPRIAAEALILIVRDLERQGCPRAALKPLTGYIASLRADVGLASCVPLAAE